MAEGDYNVVFRGALTGELAEEDVKANLGDLFKAPPGKIEALFSGRPVVVKRNVDEDTARRFAAGFRKAGALCELVPVAGRGASEPTGPGAASDTAPPAAQDSAAAESKASEGSAPETPRRPEAQPRVSSMEAAGDPNRTLVDLAVPDDLGHLAIDDSGNPHQPPDNTPPPEFDLSGMSLAEDDAPLSNRPKEPAREFDTSGMSLEPQEPARRAEDDG